MNGKVRGDILRELPEIPAHPDRDEAGIIRDPLTLHLGAELFRIADRQDDPAPAAVLRQTDQEIPADKPR